MKLKSLVKIYLIMFSLLALPSGLNRISAAKEYEEIKAATESSIEITTEVAINIIPTPKISEVLKKAPGDKNTSKNSSKADRDIVDTAITKYSYELMEKNLHALSAKYGDQMHVENLCQSALGRNIPVVVLGEKSSKLRLLVTGSIHAREYITAQLIMKQLEEYLKNYSGTMKGIKLKELFSKVRLYFIPMLNPDGVTLCQNGLSSVPSPALKTKLLHMNQNNGNFIRWKANINGVDLNRNFNAGWNSIPDKKPSPEKFKGPVPESEPETHGLVKYMEKMKFDGLICYHASGSVIYWYNNQTGKEYKSGLYIAKSISSLTNYPLVKPVKNNLEGGLKDWFVTTFHKPSLTIEVGKSGICPVPANEFKHIWNENKYVPLVFSQLIITK